MLIDILKPQHCNTPTIEIPGTMMLRRCEICGAIVPSKMIEVSESRTIKMKVIIAGSRDITELKHINQSVLESQYKISEVISGTARGVDKLGELWAKENNVNVKRFPADWDKFGKSAGVIRNKQMAEYADALIAIWDGHSVGTKHMINIALKMGLQVYVHIIKR